VILAELIVRLGRQVELDDLSLSDAVAEVNRVFPDYLESFTVEHWLRHWRSASAAALPALLRVEAGG
jgi:hypothetical protein